jgi:hypothetical protein
MSSVKISLLVLFFAAGCRPPAVAELGPEVVLSSEQRKLTWDSSTNGRLLIQEPVAKWTSETPAGFESLPPAPERFRHLLWQVKGEPDTECYLTAGVAGGLNANVARWFGQFDKPTLSASAIDALPAITVLGIQGHLLELNGTYTTSGKKRNGFAMLLAFAVDGDLVTTVKFTGPEALVERHKAAFQSLVGSIRATGVGFTNPKPANNNAGPTAGPAAGPTKSSSAEFTAVSPLCFEELPPAPERFRHLLWRVKGEPETECYLTVGVGGGLRANIDRWFGQFGQSVPDAAVLAASQKVSLLGKVGQLLELSGTFTAAGKAREGYSMLLVYTVENDQVTTLKFTGAKDVVAKHKDEFLTLSGSITAGLATVKTTADTEVVKQPVSLAPAEATPPKEAPADHKNEGSAPFVAAVPKDWQPKANSSKALHYSFGQGSEIYLGQLGNDLLANINVWRGSLGQPPIEAADLVTMPKVELLGPDAVLLEITGKLEDPFTGKKLDDARLLLAAGVRDGTLVFVKCLGPASEVLAQRAAFVQFCESIRRAP